MRKDNPYIRVLLSFLALTVPIVGIFGFLYVAVEQVYRTGADDPQVQMAEDAALSLSNGADISKVIPTDSVAIESSLAPYVIVYDRDGKPKAGSGSLHGDAPVLPNGVLELARLNGENRLTWQPEEGVRQAVVIVPYGTATEAEGFVLAGRSLREVEEREANLIFMAGIAFLVTLVATFFAVFLRERFHR